MTLATELIKLSESVRACHDVALDHERWEVATELNKFGHVVASLIAMTLRNDLLADAVLKREDEPKTVVDVEMMP